MDLYIFYFELFQPKRSCKTAWNLSLAGFKHAFLIRNCFVQTNFVRPLQHLGRSRRSWVATNNSLYVMQSHSILFRISAQARPQSHVKLWLCRAWTHLPNREQLCSRWLRVATTTPRLILKVSVAVNNFLWVRTTHLNYLEVLGTSGNYCKSSQGDSQ